MNAGALLANDDRSNVRGRRGLDDGVDRVADDELDPFALENLDDRLRYLHIILRSASARPRSYSSLRAGTRELNPEPLGLTLRLALPAMGQMEKKRGEFKAARPKPRDGAGSRDGGGGARRGPPPGPGRQGS